MSEKNKTNCASSLASSDKDTLKPDYKELDKAINVNTKALIIDYPNNPTGVVLNKDELKRFNNVINAVEIKKIP